MKITKFHVIMTIIVIQTEALPTLTVDNTNQRQAKSLTTFDYVAPGDDYQQFREENYLENQNDVEDILAEAIPHIKKKHPPTNSPVYYIRLPPQPYMYVSGLGYISQHQARPNIQNQFFNLPVSFIANGKPGTIYQWKSPIGPNTVSKYHFKKQPPRREQIPPTSQNHQGISKLYQLPGKYTFNGKPSNQVYTLGSDYNLVFSDELQHFYP